VCHQQPPGGHTWIDWRTYLSELAPQLFTNGSSRGMSRRASDSIRVALVGDSPLLRSALRHVLESACIAVVSSVENAMEAAQAERTSPVAVLIGAVTRSADAIEIRETLRCHPAARILVLGRSRDAHTVRTCLDAGARGYLALDHALDTDLIEAVRVVAAGHLYLSSQTPYLGPQTLTVPTAASRWPARDTARPRLTDCERQVLTLVAVGRSNRQIAAMLGLSANAVAVHRGNLKKTLGARTTAMLVLFALRHRLIELHDLGTDIT
jgi:DNA-binding NarL/FixJ family response regulator